MKITNVKKVGIAAPEYHALPYISASGLKTIACKSLRHYRFEKDNPPQESAALEFGRAYHTFVLENAIFAAEYAIFDDKLCPNPDMTFAAKENKAWKQAFYRRAAAEGMTVISAEDFDTITAMRDALFAMPDIAELLTGGEFEPAFVFDIEGGKGKARLDYVLQTAAGLTVIVDLKTTLNAAPRPFGIDAYKRRYHIQAAFYTDVIAAYLGKDADAVKFAFVAQEKAAPYVAQVYFVPPAVIEQGRAEYQKLVEKVRVAEFFDSWPGYETENRLGSSELFFPHYGYGDVNEYSD